MANNDLSLLMSTDRAIDLPLEHPLTFDPIKDADGEPALLSTYGPDSDVLRLVEKQITAEMMELASRSRGRPFKPPVDKYNRQRFLARINGWVGLEFGGVSFDYTAENKALVWDDPKFGIVRTMFENAMSDPAAFLTSKVS
jgi:hypothetical protein